MLTLAGANLLGDNEDREVQNFIDKFIPDERTSLLAMPWLRRSWPGLGISALTFPTGFLPEPQFKINRFRWPTMASRWAYGFFLCASDDLANTIAPAAWSSSGQYNQVPFVIGNPESNQQGTIVAGETVSCQVYVLPPTPLSGIRGLTGAVQSLYMLTIVDARYFWWYQNLGNFTLSVNTTWGDLIDACEAAIGLMGGIVIDPISSAYLQPSIQMWSLPYEPIPPILDAIAFNLGMRISVDYSGTVRMMNYTTALAALNTDMANNPNRSILSGGQKFSTTL